MIVFSLLIFLIVAKPKAREKLTNPPLNLLTNLQRPFVCQEPGCKAAFRRESHFAVHMMGHSSVRAYVCPDLTCEKAFYTEDKLIRHLKVHEDTIAAKFPESDPADEIIKRKPYACTWEGCLKRFAKHQKLKAHVCMVHEGRKPYPCTHDGCEMSFQTPSKLRKHQLVHSGTFENKTGLNLFSTQFFFYRLTPQLTCTDDFHPTISNP